MTVQERDFYAEFFQDEEKYMEYEDERGYWEDLLSCLDILLLAGKLEKTRFQEDPETYYREAASSALNNARLHIKNRLLHTKKEQRFYYRDFMEQMRLTDWESFLLLLTFAAGYDEKYETEFSKFPVNSGKKHPTLRLAVSLYQMVDTLSSDEIAKAVQKKGRFFQYFLETSKPAEYHPMSFVMVLNSRVYAFLYGRNELGEDLSGLAEIFCYTDELEPMLIRQDKKEHLSSYMAQIRQSMGSRGNVIQLYGMNGIGKRFLVCWMAKEQKTNLLFVNTAKLLMGTIAELRVLFRKLKLESLLLNAIVCFYGYEQPRATGEIERQKITPQGLWFLLDEIRQEYVLAVWLSEDKADFLRKYKLHVLYVELSVLTESERGCLWKEYIQKYTVEKDVDLDRCARRYSLTPQGIREVLWDAGIHAVSEDRGISDRQICDAVRRQMENQLGSIAAAVTSTYTWEDLVLGEEQREHLDMICNQVKYQSQVGEEWGFHRKTLYGRGISAVFYGPPGTGKTMAAQVIANELGFVLYRVDISQIVSKYIGETEKNISDLFRRARNTNAILFFDEADALFAKRSEVKDFHDRNANMETAHLLQQIEDYEGISILATNLVGNLDDAFKRRIKFMVHFSFPVTEVRKQLWETILPQETPREEEIDFSFFAEQFELTGSSIKEILTSAAFLSAAEGRGLKNQDIVKAVRLHFAKYGRVVSMEEFGSWGSY